MINFKFLQIKALTIKVKKSKLQLVAFSAGKFKRNSTLDTQATLFRNKKICATNSSDSSENKLEQILKKCPVKKFKKVRTLQVKKNTASILRTGAVVKNKIQSNDLVIDDLVAGSNNPHKFKDQFMKFIEAARIKEFQEIERKHLVGLITSEQSKLARVETAKKKQEIAYEVKQQRRQLNELLKNKQEQEIIKSKNIVRNTHLWRLKAKKTRFELVMEKKLIADKMKRLSENFQRFLQESREKELQQKLEQVYKMKQVEESSKPEKVKNSDKMSLLKLKVSLAKLHKQLEDEKEVRHKKIQQERERQKQLLTNAEMLIEIRHKLNREPKPDKIKFNIEASPDLVILRDKLAEIRKLTMKS